MRSQTQLFKLRNTDAVTTLKIDNFTFCLNLHDTVELAAVFAHGVKPFHHNSSVHSTPSVSEHKCWM